MKLLILTTILMGCLPFVSQAQRHPYKVLPYRCSKESLEKVIADNRAKNSVITIGFNDRLIRDEELEDFLNGLVDRLAAHLPAYAQDITYTIHLNDNIGDDVAISAGGEIYIKLGYLRSIPNEDNLAMVLGHEIAHAALRHHAQSVENELLPDNEFNILLRWQEFNADMLAVQLMMEAGFTPSRGTWWLENMRLGQLPTHPGARWRRKHILAEAKARKSMQKKLTRREKASMDKDFAQFKKRILWLISLGK